MSSNFLERAGLCPFFKGQIAIEEKSIEEVYRIIQVYRDRFVGVGDDGKEVVLKAKGNLIKEEVEIVVGDFVLIRRKSHDEASGDFYFIEKVLDRKNFITRFSNNRNVTLVSNIDYGLICVSLNNNLNDKRIDRFIALLNNSNVEPVIVYTKADLNSDLNFTEFKNEAKLRFGVEDVFCISIENKFGMKDFRDFFMANKSYVLLGSSGVGKSSLVNYLTGSDVQKVQAVREFDDKGMHTTVSRSMHFLDKGVLIDTPGVRGLLISASAEAIEDTFKEVSLLISQCRFSNCSHTNEPGCRLNEALSTGELESETYESFLKLQKEASYLERKVNQTKYLEEKKKWKKMSMNARKMSRL